MCGLSVIISFTDNIVPMSVLHLMNNQIIHRGPDDEGYYCHIAGDDLVLVGDDTVIDGKNSEDISFLPPKKIANYYDSKFNIGFGHRRLSIIDITSSGHQPMSIDSDNYWITYNGEIYNYQDIKKDLAKLGHRFISSSDTEVILAAYKEYGDKCLDIFRGMFAFVIYDKVRNVIFAARDRFGIKPLYYYISDKAIYFASEIKQFTVLPEWRAKLNQARAIDFLVYGIIDHTDETLFSDVKQLRGGQYTQIKLNQLQNYKSALDIVRWYDIQAQYEKYTGSYDDACKDFEQNFTKAIKSHLAADVEIGACLSGGLDSSAIVCAVTKELDQSTLQLKTFTATSSEPKFDESEYAEEVITKTNVSGYYCEPQLDDLFTVNDKITWHQDEPFGSTSIYAQWCVFNLAKRSNIKVLLDGQGADELLGGYADGYCQAIINEKIAKFKWLEAYLFARQIKKVYGFSVVKVLIKSICYYLPKFTIKPIAWMVSNNYDQNTNWLNKRFLPSKLTNLRYSELRSFKKMSILQITTTNLPMLLHFEDRDSMASSIESRVPFLDERFAEMIYNFPSEYKLSANGITKNVMRDGLRCLLPEKIRLRTTKLGFETAERIWIKQNSELFRQKLVEAFAISGAIFNRQQVMQIFEEIVSGKRRFDLLIWRIISFGTWLRVFKVTI